jgi:hypothetical protein
MFDEAVSTFRGAEGSGSVPKDLNELPKLHSSLSYLYVEKAVAERDENTIVFLHKREGSCTNHLSHGASCSDPRYYYFVSRSLYIRI